MSGIGSSDGIDVSRWRFVDNMRDALRNGAPLILTPWSDIIQDPPVADNESILQWPSASRNAAGSGLLGARWSWTLPRQEAVGTQTGLYPHLKTKTIEYAWSNKITQLATNTTLATATLYTTESRTFYVPETISRKFLSVRLIASYRTEYAASNTVNGWRMQIALGGGAAVTFDRSAITAQSSASRNIWDCIDFECSDYFNASFGSGTSQTCTAGLAVSTNNAEVINNLTFRLVITYAFDPNGANTRIKTVRIPIHGMAAQLTTSHVEVGTDGVIPAPSNQIPALTGASGIIPEASPTIRQVFLEITSNDSNQGGAVAFTPYVQIDATAEVARATLDAALAPYMLPYWDNYDLTGAIDYTVAHSFSMRSTVTAKLSGVSAILHVTYEYDHSTTTTALYSVMLPGRIMGQQMSTLFETPNGTSVNAIANQFGSLQDATRVVGTLDIQEPGPITLKQSAFLTIVDNSFINTAHSAAFVANQNSFFSGFRMTINSDVLSTGAMQFFNIVHRGDAAMGSGGWTLARGTNYLVGVTGTGGTMREFGHLMLVNYTAGVRGDVDSGNHTLNFHAKSFQTASSGSAVITPEEAETKFPIPTSPYKLVAFWLETFGRGSGSLIAHPSFMTLDGESFTTAYGQGLIRIGTNQSGGTVTQCTRGIVPLEGFNKDNLHTTAMDVTRNRRTLMGTSSAWFTSGVFWLTVSNHAFSVAGTVTINGSPAADGATVKVYADDSTPGRDGPDLVTTATISGGAGAFTVNVPDNTRTYRVTYNDGVYAGASLDGTPGSSTFNVTMSGFAPKRIGSPAIQRSA